MPRGLAVEIARVVAIQHSWKRRCAGPPPEKNSSRNRESANTAELVARAAALSGSSQFVSPKPIRNDKQLRASQFALHAEWHAPRCASRIAFPNARRVRNVPACGLGKHSAAQPLEFTARAAPAT